MGKTFGYDANAEKLEEEKKGNGLNRCAAWGALARNTTFNWGKTLDRLVGGQRKQP